jgi:hypothetical protein
MPDAVSVGGPRDAARRVHYSAAMRALAALWCCALVAQPPLYPELVLTRLAGGSGAPVAQLLEVDLTGGTVTPLPRFASDTLPPSAVARDPYDGSIFVALDAGGTSTVRRLERTATGFVESLNAQLPGRVTGMMVLDDALAVAVDAPGGGVYRIPRSGGVPVLTFAQPNLTAMQGFDLGGSVAALAFTGRIGTAQTQSGFAVVDVFTGQVHQGPLSFANPAGTEVTGVADLSGHYPSHLLAFADGRFAAVDFLTGPVNPIAITPVPPGGAAAMRFPFGYGPAPLVLGGAPFPYLYEAAIATAVASPRSPALPGDPVDFARGLWRNAHAVPFGARCGPSALWHGMSGTARPGTTMYLTVQAPPTLPLILVLGFDDFAAGALPYPLPGGCLLRVLPVGNVFHVANAAGAASQGVTLPAGTGCLGIVLYSQWIGLAGLPGLSGLSTSPALANWIGP